MIIYRKTKCPHPLQYLKVRSAEWSVDIDSEEFARMMDEGDPLKGFRDKFNYPKVKDLPFGMPSPHK